MLQVIRTEQAEADLEQILDYLEERSPAAAERLAAAIDERCQLLGTVPALGSPRDDIRPGLRCVVVQRYVLFYRVTEQAVEVLRILHGSRDIDTLMREDEG